MIKNDLIFYAFLESIYINLHKNPMNNFLADFPVYGKRVLRTLCGTIEDEHRMIFDCP